LTKKITFVPYLCVTIPKTETNIIKMQNKANILENQLETFRTNYNSTKVMVYDNNMVYSVAKGWADKAALEANNIISKLGLQLKAVPTTFLSKDSFLIEFKN
jgi:hypothetical protein